MRQKKGRKSPGTKMTDLATRPIAPEDDASEQLGFETPRSGVATPQPDPQDRRLPGISSSYFGQVCSNLSNTAPFSDLPGPNPKASPNFHKATPRRRSMGDVTTRRPVSDSVLYAFQTLRVGEEEEERRTDDEKAAPSSSSSSSSSPAARQHVQTHNVSGASPQAPPTLIRESVHRKTHSENRLLQGRSISVLPALGGVVTAWSTHATDISTPESRAASQLKSTPSTQASSISEGDGRRFAPLELLKKLTWSSGDKSGHSTPVRSLSVAQQPSEPSGSQSSPPNSGPASQPNDQPAGAQTPSTKGKLTVKIVEARGIRPCFDPYVVAVFQRSELISSGPQTFNDNVEIASPGPMMGGVAIQRQASSSGGFPVAIPMRSRQSSNTSVTDYAAFRNRTRKTFTSPQWDAEAILLVPMGDSGLVSKRTGKLLRTQC